MHHCYLPRRIDKLILPLQQRRGREGKGAGSGPCSRELQTIEAWRRGHLGFSGQGRDVIPAKFENFDTKLAMPVEEWCIILIKP